MPKAIDIETHRQLLSDMNRLRQRVREYSLSNDMLGMDAAAHLDSAWNSMREALLSARLSANRTEKE